MDGARPAGHRLMSSVQVQLVSELKPCTRRRLPLYPTPADTHITHCPPLPCSCTFLPIPANLSMSFYNCANEHSKASWRRDRLARPAPMAEEAAMLGVSAACCSREAAGKNRAAVHRKG